MVWPNCASKAVAVERKSSRSEHCWSVRSGQGYQALIKEMCVYAYIPVAWLLDAGELLLGEPFPNRS